MAPTKTPKLTEAQQDFLNAHSWRTGAFNVATSEYSNSKATGYWSDYVDRVAFSTLRGLEKKGMIELEVFWRGAAVRILQPRPHEDTESGAGAEVSGTGQEAQPDSREQESAAPAPTPHASRQYNVTTHRLGEAKAALRQIAEHKRETHEDPLDSYLELKRLAEAALKQLETLGKKGNHHG